MKQESETQTKRVREDVKKSSYEPPDNTMDVSYNIGQTAGGSNIPDSDDIPGGFAGSGEDMLGSLYGSYRDRQVDHELAQQFQKGGKHSHRKKK